MRMVDGEKRKCLITWESLVHKMKNVERELEGRPILDGDRDDKTEADLLGAVDDALFDAWNACMSFLKERKDNDR